MEKHGTETASERIDFIERRHRRTRQAGAVMFAGVVALMVGGTDMIRRPKVIEAEQFVLRDRGGVVRARLAMKPDGSPKFSLCNERGTDQLTLETSSDHTAAINIYESGDLRVSLWSASDGSSSLRFLDRRQASTSAMFMWPDGTTGIAMNNGEGGLLSGVQPDGVAGSIVTDKYGIERERLGILPPGRLRLSSQGSAPLFQSAPRELTPHGPQEADARGSLSLSRDDRG